MRSAGRFLFRELEQEFLADVVARHFERLRFSATLSGDLHGTRAISAEPGFEDFNRSRNRTSGAQRDDDFNQPAFLAGHRRDVLPDWSDVSLETFQEQLDLAVPAGVVR